jgi:hypothetical protein
MLLSDALLALFMTGFWLYCLTDAILTPAAHCRGLRKQGWVALIAVTFVVGAFAWLIVRRPVHDSPRVSVLPWDQDGADDEDAADAGGAADSPSLNWTDADDAAARHPAGRAKVTDPDAAPKGPDDDPGFLSALDRVIRRNPPVSLLPSRLTRRNAPVSLRPSRSAGRR